MKALSVRQPWASLICSGRKTIELRTWSTKYRGDIVILAGGSPWKGGDHGHELGPMGVSICVVELADVRPFTRDDIPASCVPASLVDDRPRFSWLLCNPRAVLQKPAKGRLGLYDAPGELLADLGLTIAQQSSAI